MSLLSIRDLSVISTPPEHRQPVKTFVARYDELVIKEAVNKELRRGGQVFFVHNRVKSIHQMASLIQKLVPEAKIAVAHGQMAGKDLEEIMVSFVQKKINVLVSTTIIESGLDIPSANTIVINRADTLGLAEIYQLRGRVGRSSTQSFAYLLVPSLDSLSKDSRERLRALMDCNELGGGFKLAMSDLQIRGGGNLLGVSQSGNIAAIGYDLYLDLLQKTVADLKAQALKAGRNSSTDDIDPEVNLQLSAYIPESYIPDISQRYITYRRMAALATSPPEMQDDLQDELVDRYGPLPVETVTLFRVISLKKELAALRISKLEQGRDSLVFTFLDDTPLSPEMLMAYLQKNSGGKTQIAPKLTPDSRLVVGGRLSSLEHIFDTIVKTLDEFTTMVQAGI
jgi:transcription-repair coupling factor (superfamily II helicase)